MKLSKRGRGEENTKTEEAVRKDEGAAKKINM